MRKNKSNQLSRNGSSSTPVRIEYTDATALVVCVAGTFNDWRAGATPMVGLGDGRWIKELVLPPGRHEYMFVVDGQWRVDPRAADRVPNPFGGENGVVIVPALEARAVGEEPPYGGKEAS
jgi:hypothetical protein